MFVAPRLEISEAPLLATYFAGARRLLLGAFDPLVNRVRVLRHVEAQGAKLFFDL
jgi:hypothetical protein